MKATKFGSRGEWWVVAQVIWLPFVAGVAFFTRSREGWPVPFHVVGFALGLVCAVLGVVFVVGGASNLGRNLTTVPKPIDGGELVQTGLYAIVRHPVYCGVIFGAFAWALLLNSLLGIALAVTVPVFFDLKSRREEAWLISRYPAYASYRRRVRKLIPMIY